MRSSGRAFKPRVRGSSPRAGTNIDTGTKIEFRFGSWRSVTAAAYSQCIANSSGTWRVRGRS